MCALTLFHYYRNYTLISMFKSRQRTFYWLNYLPIWFLKMYFISSVLFVQSRWVFLFFIAQILLVCLGHIAGSFFVNQCSECFLCFNITCICSLCTKFCGHIFLNRLLLLLLYLVLLLLLFLLIVIITDFRLAFFHWDLSLAATVFHASATPGKDWLEIAHW